MKMTDILKRFFPSSLLLLSGSLSYAYSFGGAYSFLDIPASSHAYALGGSGSAIVDDDVALAAQNPALIGSELERQLAVGYMHYMAGGNFASATYGSAAGDHGAWAFGIRYLDYGSMEGFTPDGVATGSFSPKDLVVEGTYSRDITSRWRGGINLKMIYSNYEDYSAYALAADLGVNYYDEERDLSLSLTVKNLGGQLKKFDSQNTSLPINLELAYMQALGVSPFSLAITATDLTRWRLPYYNHDTQNPEDRQKVKEGFGSNLFRHLIFGLQYNPSDRFYVAVGYNYRTRTDMSTYHRTFLSGWSAGFGLKASRFAAGVALAQPHSSATNVMLNLSMGF